MKNVIAFFLFSGCSVISSLGQSSLSIQPDETGTALDLIINGTAGQTYVIQSATDLEDFADLDTVTLESSSLVWSLTDSTGQAFFRLREEVSQELSYQIETLPGVLFMTIPAGSFIMGDNEAKGPIADDFKPERTVNMSEFAMSEAEITNAQYVDFLNAALAEGVIEVTSSIPGPPSTFVVGTASSSYEDRKLIDLGGSRVLKDHDGDGSLDPENPLNQCWIEFDDGSQTFQVKDPQAIDWDAFVYEPGESRSDWEDLAEGQLPSVQEVAQWPVTFIKWYGAHAFAEFYGVSLPTEAQWEYVSQGGMGYAFGTDDGTIDATKANYNENNAHPDSGHVVVVKSYAPNPFGIYDLAGNVWEWCADWYDPDFYSTQPDPDTDPYNDSLVVEDTEPVESPSYTGGPGQAYTGDTKVKRGGSWNFHEASLGSSARERDYTWRGNDHFGIRLVNNSPR